MSDFEDAKLILTPNAYKAGKAYSVKPFDGSGDFTVVRNTTATTRNSSGNLESVAVNVPRLNYPIGGGCPSWLIEPQATNLVINSSQIGSTGWSRPAASLSVTLDSLLSPDNTTSATLVNCIATTTDQKFLIKTPNQVVNIGEQFTQSFFLKAGTYDKVVLVHTVNGLGTTFVNLTTKTIISNSAGTTSTIENYPNDWVRVTQTTPIESTGANRVFGVYFSNTALNSITSTLSVGDNFYVWGAQLEQGNLTSYIPTNGSTVTRNADVLTVAPPSGTTEIVETLEDITYYIGGNNLVTNSEDFTDASWSKTNTTITANSIVSPDGTSNADRLIANVSVTSLNGSISKILPKSATSITYTASVYVKNEGFDTLAFYAFGSSFSNRTTMFITSINSETFTISSAGGYSHISAEIIDEGGGWKRVIMTYTTDSAGINRFVVYQPFSNTGDGINGIGIWGAQLEQGSTATDYQATRDIVVVPTTYQLPNGEIKKVIMK